MALNDKSMGIGANKGVDIHPGIANPTAHGDNSNPLVSNFVIDPTTDDAGAGAGPDFQGGAQAQRGFKQTAGVIEGRPGIIESSNIDPLNEDSNKDDGWANVTNAPSSAMTGNSGNLMNTASSAVSSAANMASGAANYAYGAATGDNAAKESGKEAVWG